MASKGSRSPSKVILTAAHFAANGNVDNLEALIATQSEYLPTQLILRILLTCLPETLEPGLYVPFLQRLSQEPKILIRKDGARVSRIDSLPESDARRQIRLLKLQKLLRLKGCEAQDLTCFLIQRVHQIYEETGMLSLAAELVTPFLNSDPLLKRWYINTVLPLLRTLYEYYPDGQQQLSLQSLETGSFEEGVNNLLEGGGRSENGLPEAKNVARDLRALVGPYLYGSTKHKRLKLDTQASPQALALTNGVINPTSEPDTVGGWTAVGDWIRDAMIIDKEIPLALVNQWSGADDIDLGGYGEQEHLLGPDDPVVTVTRRRVLQYAVEAALEAGDFETAYSWILTRVVPPTPGLHTTTTQPSEHADSAVDDISWRIAFSAGKYPAKQPSLSRLQKRQELLSHALVLAPAKHMAEVLGTWRRCEEELNTMTAEEDRKVKEWDDQAPGDEAEEEFIPGGWASSPPGTLKLKGGNGKVRPEVSSIRRPKAQRPTSRATEPPMSLFDVARSAASTLSKSAVAAGIPIAGVGLKRQVSVSDVIKTPRTPMSPGQPLSPGRKRDIPGRTIRREVERIEGSSGSDEGKTTDEDGDRVRKRDVVLSTVTGGLASGIGWVLGATPEK